MEQKIRKGLLVVSFGTSVNETRRKTIDVIEADLGTAFADCARYRAWTSERIIKIRKERDGVQTDTVSEAMERMLADGIEAVTVQPTYVTGGIENDRMTADVLAYRGRFASIRLGTPLLTDGEDFDEAAEAVMAEFGEPEPEEALVLMGHGTLHKANSVYGRLEVRFRERGCGNVFLGTVEAGPPLETLIRRVQASGAKRVTLAPLMVVAGDHARNDMAGEDGDSWKSRFEAAGCEVRCVLKGLGEYPRIRKLYVRHARRAFGRQV